MDWQRIANIIQNESERYFVEQEFNQYISCYTQILESSETMLDNFSLVQLNRSAIQEILDKDPLVYSEAEREQIRIADQFVLEHIEDAKRWFHPIGDSPEHYWWDRL